MRNGCPPGYNGGFCADYAVDCDVCWAEWRTLHPTHITHYEKVKGMSIEELADLFSKIEQGDPENHLGKDGWLVWLKMEGKT